MLSPHPQPLPCNIQPYKLKSRDKTTSPWFPPNQTRFSTPNPSQSPLKRLGTKGELSTFKVERLDRRFPIRKAPISVNMSGWSNSGIIRRPRRVLLQTSRNVRRWILLVNGFLWVSNTSRIRWVEGEISEKQDGALNWPGYFCNFHNDLEWKSPFPFREKP